MGYYSFGSITPDKDKIMKMFTLLESRGRDASGFAYINNGKLIVNKAAIKSSEMIKSKEWNDLLLPKIMILHTRLKTQGEPKNNMNNHPLFTKSGLCIVHNGMIYNDKEIFGRKEKRDAEVDSEAILAVLSDKKAESIEDKIKRVFDRLEGGFAVASINKNDPGRLVLFRKDNPIQIYYNTIEDILYFCSEREIMQSALGIKKILRRGFSLGEGDYHSYEMENNHALILNSEGVEEYRKFHPRRETWYYGPDELIIECPHCLSSTVFYEGRLFNRCEFCGQPINEEDLYV